LGESTNMGCPRFAIPNAVTTATPGVRSTVPRGPTTAGKPRRSKGRTKARTTTGNP